MNNTTNTTAIAAVVPTDAPSVPEHITTLIETYGNARADALVGAGGEALGELIRALRAWAWSSGVPALPDCCVDGPRCGAGGACADAVPAGDIQQQVKELKRRLADMYNEYELLSQAKDRARDAANKQPAAAALMCPFPCGWKNLHTLAVQDGAYLARHGWNEDDEGVSVPRATAMRLVDNLIQVCRAALNAERLNAAAVPALPERDSTKLAEDQGLFRKFHVTRTDGSAAAGGKHHGCRYFVLDVDHDAYARSALSAYANACEATHPALALDLREKWGAEVPATSPALRREHVARAVWDIRRESEDRCDIELYDLPRGHSVWAEADAVIAAIENGNAGQPLSNPEALDADMFWDAANPEGGASSLHNVIVEAYSNASLLAGDIVEVQRARCLPNICVRITAIEDEDGNGDLEYEVIDAAIAALSKGDDRG